LARCLLHLLPSSARESVVGDLEEEYADLVEGNRGSIRAGLWFWGQTLRSLLSFVGFKPSERSIGEAIEGRPPLGDSLEKDLRFALRTLRGNPTFATVAAATVAIGMAATTAMLSIGHALLVRPPPVSHPDQMVSVWELRSGDVSTGPEGLLLPYPRYEQYRAATREVFEDLAAHSYRGFGVVTDQGSISVDGFLTSGNYFAVLGLVPRVGRLYDSADEEAVVISERLWHSRFGADPDVIDRTISIGNRRYTVIGVVSQGFTGTMAVFTGDLWVPAVAYARSRGAEESWIDVAPIGRLRPGIERDVAEERVAAVAVSIEPENPRVTVRGARFHRLKWREDNEALLRIGLGVLLAAALLVLLIGCTNIASMTVARSHERRREIAVRMAIGAGRGRLVRQMLIESLLLAVVGGVAGVALAYVGTVILSAIELPVSVTVTLDATPDGSVLLVSFLIAAMTGVLFGLRPAIGATGVNLAQSLKEGAQSPAVVRTRNAFVVGQLALATLLLTTAGLFLRSFGEVVNRPLGFDPEGVKVVSVSLASLEYREEEGRIFFERLIERVRAIPGVQAAGLGRFVLLGGGNASRRGSAVDADENAPALSIEYNTVDPGFFDANQVELMEGRLFSREDLETAPPVAVINRTLAERLWPGQSAIGRVFRTGNVEHEVVGVVRSGVYVFAAEAPKAYSYHPFSQDYRPSMALHVRAAGPVPPVASQVRDVVKTLEPNATLGEWRTMEEVLSVSTFFSRFLAWLSALFGGVGLFLGVMGVYGLLAVQVAQRNREFGVRMAIGASALDVLVLVVSRGARMAVLGCLAGIVFSVLGGHWLKSLLFYAVSPYDVTTFALVPTILIGAVAVASFVPARRATNASPAATLREE
jgi:predicted permease